jgi:hypothetical protein
MHCIPIAQLPCGTALGLMSGLRGFSGVHPDRCAHSVPSGKPRWEGQVSWIHAHMHGLPCQITT